MLEKISTDLEYIEFYKFFYVWLTKLKNNQILLNKIINIFLLTTKLFTRWKILIWVNHLAVSTASWSQFHQQICPTLKGARIK